MTLTVRFDEFITGNLSKNYIIHYVIPQMMLWGAKFQPHIQTDGAVPQGKIHISNPYILNLYRFQIDPTKTLGEVQDRILEINHLD